MGVLATDQNHEAHFPGSSLRVFLLNKNGAGTPRWLQHFVWKDIHSATRQYDHFQHALVLDLSFRQPSLVSDRNQLLLCNDYDRSVYMCGSHVHTCQDSRLCATTAIACNSTQVSNWTRGELKLFSQCQLWTRQKRHELEGPFLKHVIRG